MNPVNPLFTHYLPTISKVKSPEEINQIDQILISWKEELIVDLDKKTDKAFNLLNDNFIDCCNILLQHQHHYLKKKFCQLVKKDALGNIDSTALYVKNKKKKNYHLYFLAISPRLDTDSYETSIQEIVSFLANKVVQNKLEKLIVDSFSSHDEFYKNLDFISVGTNIYKKTLTVQKAKKVFKKNS